MIQLTTLSEQRGAWHAIRPMLGTASELHEIRQQGLAQRLRGHYGYYAIRGNKNRAWSFLGEGVQSQWRRRYAIHDNMRSNSPYCITSAIVMR